MDIHRFNLLEGFEVQVRPMDGRHQTMLTKQSQLTFPERISTVMADLVDYVGSVRRPDAKFFDNMLAGHRAKIMYEIRQFSLDFDMDFKFKLDFYNPKTKRKEPVEFDQMLEHEIEEEVEGELVITKHPGLRSHPYKVLVDGEYVPRVYEADADYQAVIDIDKYIYTTLPKSGKEIRFRMLDGRGESLGAKFKKEDLSSAVLLDMRFIQEKLQLEKSVQWLEARHETYNIKDLTHIRTLIQKHEGRLDSETKVTNPFDESEQQVLNILGSVSFFFPGGVI